MKVRFYYELRTDSNVDDWAYYLFENRPFRIRKNFVMNKEFLYLFQQVSRKTSVQYVLFFLDNLFDWDALHIP